MRRKKSRAATPEDSYHGRTPWNVIFGCGKRLFLDVSKKMHKRSLTFSLKRRKINYISRSDNKRKSNLVTEGFGVLRKEVMVKNIEKEYDHPLAEIVQIASQYKSEILLEYDKYKINAKSIMGIIAFNPSEGMNVTISANGKDEGDAVEALERFFICGQA